MLEDMEGRDIGELSAEDAVARRVKLADPDDE